MTKIPDSVEEFQDVVERLTAAEWKVVLERINRSTHARAKADEDVSGHLADDIMEMVRRKRTPAQKEARRAALERLHARNAAIARAVSRMTAASQAEATRKAVSVLLQNATVALGLRARLMKSPDGRRAMETLLAPFEGLTEGTMPRANGTTVRPRSAPGPTLSSRRRAGGSGLRARPKRLSPDHTAVRKLVAEIRSRLKRPADLASLTARERLIYRVVVTMDEEIQNGGVDQFLRNNSGDEGQRVIADLRKIGARGAHQVLSEAAAWFKGRRIPTDASSRFDQLIAAEARDPEEFGVKSETLTRRYYDATPELYRAVLSYESDGRTSPLRQRARERWKGRS
jgi:hypothetical protein